MTHPLLIETTGAAGQLPPVAPQVTGAAVADLPPRLRKRLDAEVERIAAAPISTADDGVHIECGPEAVVVLATGASGVISEPAQARCSCLLSPRCLHRAAVLMACPVADPAKEPEPEPEPATEPVPALESESEPAGDLASTSNGAAAGRTRRVTGPTRAQRAAATALWQAAAAVLAAGVPAAGAVPQAELLRAAHSARLAGLPRAESAALRVVRGLRAARARQDSHRLADLVEVLHDLLLTTGRLAAGDADPDLVGVVRRSYKPGGGLQVYGICREPVISATGYAGVVTHLIADDGRRFSLADVKPGGPDRAWDSANAVTELGSGAVNHAHLARGGLLITGTTVSPDGRLGAGRGVRANPVTGVTWSTGPLARLFDRPLAEVVSGQLAAEHGAGPDGPARAGTELIGCDLVVLGAVGDQLLARELPPAAPDTGPGPDSGPDSGPGLDSGPGPDSGRPAEPGGPLIRLVPANSHPRLAHLANLRRLASWPGLRIRVVGRLDPDRASTLRPLAVGPVPGAGPTLRLPESWLGRADLGYDQLQGLHLPPRDPALMTAPVTATGPDPVATAPLWRVRRLVELAVAGGRRAVGEAARGDDSGLGIPLRRAGFQVAAGLAAALADESDRTGRDVFGRLTDPDPDRYAWAWVAAATHLAATERELVRASWSDPPGQ